MRHLATVFVSLSFLVAGMAQGATIRYKSSGNWLDTTNSTGNVNGWRSLAVPTLADLGRINWGANTVTLTTTETIGALQVGVDEIGTLVVANGGNLSTVAGSGEIGRLTLGQGNNPAGTGTMNVESGGLVNVGDIMFTGNKADGTANISGTVNVGSHLWTGWNNGFTGTININDGGVLSVSGMLGLNWQNNGAIGLLNVNDGGTLNLSQLHSVGGELLSIQGDSLLSITGSGQLVYSGDGGTNRIALYVANGKIVANGVPEDVVLSVDTNTGYAIATAAIVPPDPPLDITAFTGSGGALDFEWSLIPGKQFDLISSESLATATETWPIYNDGVTTYENILNAASGANTLTGVLPVGGPRYFAIRKEFGPPITLFAEDFDGGPGLPLDWTSGTNVADTGTTAWEVGAPISVGPAAANSLSNCAATGIAANYGANSDIWLRSPAIDLTGEGVLSNGATLVFRQSREIEVASDAGSIRVLNATNLVQIGADVLAPIAGDVGAWEQVAVDLPDAALGQVVKLEFQFESDASNGYLWNSSFEEPVLANGELVDAEEGLYGWQRGRYGAPGEPFRDRDSSGVWIKNPDDLNELEFLPDGDNVGFVDGKYDWDVGIRQVLQINLESNTQYDVSVWVASSYDNGDGTIIPLPSNRVELVTGDTILAATPEVATPAYSTWVQRTLNWNSTGVTNNIGEPLEIRLINVAIGDGVTGGQALGFDDVTLTVTPAPGPVDLAGWYIDDVEVTTPIP